MVEEANVHESPDEVRRSLDLLIAADRRKNELLTMLAAELRNPLATLSATVPLISRRDPIDEIEARAREVLARQINVLDRLAEDLLEVARVTDGVIELHHDRVDLPALLGRVASIAQKSMTGPRGQTLSTGIPSWPLWIRGDAIRLERAFTNVLDYASKHAKSGGHLHFAMSLGERAEGSYVRIVVTDGGIPVALGQDGERPPPFALSRGAPGIGLALARTLIEVHGGELTARREGLEIEVTLPVPNEPTSPSEAAALGAAPQPSPGGRRVLVVEDNADAQQVLCDLLAIWGHEVLIASDGPAALEQALTKRPDVALIDLGLPGMDGHEVARRIRSDPAGGSMLLVALTGYAHPDQQDESRAAGFDLHVVKPMDPARLAAVIAQSPRQPGTDGGIMRE